MSKTIKSLRQSVSQIQDIFTKKSAQQRQDPYNQCDTGEIPKYKSWLDLQYHDSDEQFIKKPDELEKDMKEPPSTIDDKLLGQIKGSLIGMTIGDALGAHVEFRPHQYLIENPVTDMEGGGTWGLSKGQFTDDTSMALCLANSLVTQKKFNPYDQLVRYKWWYREGYMSSTGQCFDIGMATSESLNIFQNRQKAFANKHKIQLKDMDYISDENLINQFDIYCSKDQVAGNGALMRLAPVPLFFYRYPEYAVEYSGISGKITHGDKKSYDACRYYGALIVAVLRGYTKDQILDKQFYSKHIHWFSEKPLCIEIKRIAEGSYRKNGGYADGIRGKGYIVDALEAALWAFWSDENSFQKGALAAVNLGDDTDTTAAIYGQLAGACYGYQGLPRHWRRRVYAKRFIINLSKWIAFEGDLWKPSTPLISNITTLPSKSHSDEQSDIVTSSVFDSDVDYSQSAATDSMITTPKYNANLRSEKSLNPRHQYNSASNFSMSQPIRSSKSPLHDGMIQGENLNLQSNFVNRFVDTAAAAEVSLKKSDLTVQLQSIEENVRASESIAHHKKTSQENNQLKLRLHDCKSISSTDEYVLSNQTNSNPNSYIQDDRNAKLTLDRRFSEKYPDLSKNILFSTGKETHKSAFLDCEHVNRNNDPLLVAQNRFPNVDSSRVTHSSTKHSTGSSLIVIRSPQAINENLTSIKPPDEFRSSDYRSEAHIAQNAIDNQERQTLEPEHRIKSRLEHKVKREKHSENMKTMDTLDLTSMTNEITIRNIRK